MPATIPTQEDLDILKLAFDDHLKVVDAKLLEYDGLPEREKHDFADLELRVKKLEDALSKGKFPEFTVPVRPRAISFTPGDGEDAPYPENPDNPVNPEGSPPLDPPPSKVPKKHK